MVYLSFRDLRDLFCQFGQQCVHLWVGALSLANLAAGVHNGCMVSPAQVATNLFEAVLGQISR